jgi:hypothetical protein
VPDAGKPLVELTGIDRDDDKNVLQWRAERERGNRYANFDATAPMAVVKPPDEGMVKERTRSQWIDNVGEPPDAEKRFGEVKFAAPVPELKNLATATPADLAVKSFDFADLAGDKPLGAGVDPARLKNLPPTPNEPKPE